MYRAFPQLGNTVQGRAWNGTGCQSLQGDAPPLNKSLPWYIDTSSQELPKRKQAVTQEKSKAVRETENPFGVDDDDDDKPSSAGPSQGSGRRGTVNTDTRVTGTIHSFAYDSKEKKKKEKEKKNKKQQHKPFNLEAEKDQMKAHIAEASIAATNLTNTLQTINREKERISENATALQRFETCKSLRRKILRYVSYL